MGGPLIKGSFRKGKVNCDFEVTRRAVPGQLCVDFTLTAAGRGGDVKLHKGMFCVDLVAISNAVKESMSANAPVGWSWKSMKKKVGKVANKAAVNKIARQLSDAASDPRFQQVAAVAAVVYPPLGIPMGVAVKAADMYKKASAGDPTAKAQMMEIIKAAQAGGTKEQAVAKAFAVFNQAEKTGHNVGAWADSVKRGWWANVPYRSNLAAGALDRTRPGDVHRKLLNIELEAMARGQR